LLAPRATDHLPEIPLDPDHADRPTPDESEGRIGLFGTFASAAVEAAFRGQCFRDDLWLARFVVSAAMLRVALLLLTDYQHLGVGPAFWALLAVRLLFLLISAWALLALGRAACPAAADRLFFAWCLLLAALTVYALASRPPSNTTLPLMSFGVVLLTYCVTPLPLPRQAALALAFSAAALFVSRRADGITLSTVALAYALSNLFGAAMSWRLNRRRREAYLGGVREAGLRAGLQKALAEVRTLRGLLSICAWCKRIRDEQQAWQSVEAYVQSHTDAAFTHGMCPDCLRSQVAQLAGARR
jgi:hypothetical protein